MYVIPPKEDRKLMFLAYFHSNLAASLKESRHIITALWIKTMTSGEIGARQKSMIQVFIKVEKGIGDIARMIARV